MSYASRYTTNNFAEYKGLMIIRQLTHRRKPKSLPLLPWYEQARSRADGIHLLGWYHHYRQYNKMADGAANQAMDNGTSYQAFGNTSRPEIEELREWLHGDISQWAGASLETTNTSAHDPELNTLLHRYISYAPFELRLATTKPQRVWRPPPPPPTAVAPRARPSCTWTRGTPRVPLSGSPTAPPLVLLDLKRRNITRVESIPSTTELLDLSWNPGVAADLSSFHGVAIVYARGCELSTLSSFLWPPQLQELNLRGNRITRLDAHDLPTGLRKLKLSQNAVHSLAWLASLTQLEVLLASGNLIAALDHALPPRLRELDVSENHVRELADLTFPSTLEKLNISHNSLDMVTNTSFSRALTLLDLRATQLQSFQLSAGGAVLFRANVTVLSSLQDWKHIDARACQDNASLVWVSHVPVCIVHDSQSDSSGGGGGFPSGTRRHQANSASSPLRLLAVVGMGALVVLVLVVFGIVLAVKHRRQAPPSTTTPKAANTKTNQATRSSSSTCGTIRDESASGS